MKKLLAVLSVIVLVAGLSGCIRKLYKEYEPFNDPENIYQYDIDHNAVSEFESSAMYQMEFHMKFNEMDYHAGASNPIEKYEEIKEDLREDYAIVYYDRLGETECDKIMQVLGYEDFDDFMRKKGYLDKEGNPSVTVLRYSTYERVSN